MATEKENIELNKKDKSERKGGFKNKVEEYANTTNIHGLRYIFMAVSPIARLIWLILFLAAIAAFLYQVQDRVRVYLRRPVSVNIDVASNFSLIFPAVTVCNSNNFRLSEAMRTGTYKYLADVFNSKPNRDASLEELDRLNYTYLQTNLAHQKEHMILSCHWKSFKCSPANFTPILTDYGLCYTFNNDRNNILTVENTGAAFGLELLLNMERYEYMTGAHVSTGIRILMHNHGENPRMADLGISIPASMNAMVAMELTELNDLPKPHGNCTNSDFRSREACVVDCKIANLANVCHCRPMYGIFNDSVPLCNATGHLKCVEESLGKQLGQEACNKKCKVPCQQLMYAASLSYTTTSDFMARAQAKQYSNDSGLVERSKKATLDLHHVDSTFLEEDNSVMSAFLNKYHKFYNKLLNLHESGHKDNQHIMEMHEAFEETEKCLHEKQSLYAETLKLHIIPGLVELTVERFNHQVRTLENTILPKFTKQVHDNTTYGNITDSIQEQFEEDLWWLDHKMRMILSELELTKSTYWDALEALKVEYKNPESKLPMTILREYKDQLISAYSNFVDACGLVIDRVKIFLKYVKQFRHRPDNDGITYLIKETSEMNVVLEEFEEATEELESVTGTITDEYRHEISNIQSIEQSVITSAKFHLRLSKLYAKEFLLSQPHLLEFDEFIDETNNLSGGFQLEYLVRELQNSDLWNHTLDHTKSLMETLDKIRSAAKAAILNAEEVPLTLEQAAAEFNGTNGCPQFADIIKHLNSYKKQIEHLPAYIAAVQKDYDRLLTRHTTLDRYLENLKDSYAINYKFIKRNFLTVRVFYQKLNFQRITKAEGYQWFSLICDIGGSFGLYLGASLLTLAELLYFIGKNFTMRGTSDKIKSSVSLNMKARPKVLVSNNHHDSHHIPSWPQNDKCAWRLATHFPDEPQNQET